MSPYQALARKWRPRKFDQLVGQPHIVKILTNALTQNKIHHAYLFTGYHGIGKTTLARILAKCLNCETGITATPCDQCNHCKEIDAGRFPDLFEIDAASRTKVEDTRDLLDNIPYAPIKGRFKVYLIDEVHMLSGHSFNALLKTLEEPPEHVKFLLATTDPQKLPATVLSRCLQFHLSKITAEQIEQQLSFILKTEKIPFEQAGVALVAQAANGSMRDGLSLLDQCIAHGNGAIKVAEIQALLGLSNVTEITQLIHAIHAQDANHALSLTQSWAQNGVNFSRCLSELLMQLYQLTIMQRIDKVRLPGENAALKALASTVSNAAVLQYYQIALTSQRDLPLAPTAQIGFEMIVLRMMSVATPTVAAIKLNAIPTPTAAPTTVNPQIPAPRAVDVSPRPPMPQQSDWPTLLTYLNLTGPTLALAQHCSLKNMTNDAISLTIQPKYQALLNARQQQRIQESLTQHYQRPIRVTITAQESTIETPAEAAGRMHEAQKQSVKKAISADPTIQRIVKTFDATIAENSIEPLN